MRNIDLRSDTITLPTDEMRQAIFTAKLGDDVYHEDETVIELEKLAARMVGKESAIFVVSGTMGNQLAVMTHTKRGDEVIAADASHIVQAEVGAAAVLSGVTMRTARTGKGGMVYSDVEGLIRGKNVHFPDTGLICMENATSAGTVMQVEEIEKIYRLAKDNGIPVHLDGARIFNAAASLGVKAEEIAARTDSVQFCLSKGLCAPVGSMLAGTAGFIEKARRNRKMIGGGMRQAGILAAAGIIALEKMTRRLPEDHSNARLLASMLAQIKGIEVDMESVQINMVFADFKNTGRTQEEILKALLSYGIKANDGREGTVIRFVTNHGVAKEDILYTVDVLKGILK